MWLSLESVIEARIYRRIYHVPDHNATELSDELVKVLTRVPGGINSNRTPSTIGGVA